jgi:hypothetical protein
MCTGLEPAVCLRRRAIYSGQQQKANYQAAQAEADADAAKVEADRIRKAVSIAGSGSV